MSKYNILKCMEIVGSSPETFSDEKVYVSTGAVDIDNIDYSKTELVTYNNRPSRANLVAQKDDILFAKMFGTKKVLMLDRITSENIYSTGFFAVRANKMIITPKCLYYLISSEFFLEQKDKNCSGATQKAITNTGLKKVVVNIPNVEEQEKLTKKFDIIDRLIRMRQQQLLKLDELVKSRFIEMFGDPVINPKKWSKIKLGKRCDIITGNTPSRSKVENYGTYIEWIKSDNINTYFTYLTEAEEYLSEIGFQKCRYVDTESILMTCIAGSMNCIGNVAIANRRVAFNQQIRLSSMRLEPSHGTLINANSTSRSTLYIFV